MTLAQVPISAYGTAYATIDENTFYVHGGVNLPPSGGMIQLSAQFYSLDLTQNWDTSSPPWKALQVPPPTINLSQTSRHSMTVSPNRQTLTLWSAFPTDTAANYSISTAAWSQVPLTTTSLRGLQVTGTGLHAATDPTTGLVYIPAAGLLSTKNMVKFSFLTGESILIELSPLFGGAAQNSYSFAWCQPRKSFILFSGNATTPVPFFEYTPGTSKWTTLPSLESTTPSFRQRTCLIPAYNGTKMILFGGDNGTAPSVASISILDVASMEWTNGNDAPDARSEMACSVSGDNFIVWGGYKVLFATPSVSVPTTPLIYNLKTGQWTEKYIRIPNGNSTGGGSGGGGTGAGTGPGSGAESGTGGGGKSVEGGKTGRGGSSNNSAVIGGVAGASMVIAAISIFCIWKRRQHGTRDAEMMSSNKSELLSMVNASDGPASDNYSKDTLKQRRDQNIHGNNPQYICRNEPQAVSDSPPSYSVSSYPQRAIPSRSNSAATPGGPQDHIQRLQYQNSNDQFAIQHSSNNGNPQYKPAEAGSLSSRVARAPQGIAQPVMAVNNEELLEQINSLQAEWIRRQGIIQDS